MHITTEAEKHLFHWKPTTTQLFSVTETDEGLHDPVLKAGGPPLSCRYSHGNNPHSQHPVTQLASCRAKHRIIVEEQVSPLPLGLSIHIFVCTAGGARVIVRLGLWPLGAYLLGHHQILISRLRLLAGSL